MDLRGKKVQSLHGYRGGGKENSKKIFRLNLIHRNMEIERKELYKGGKRNLQSRNLWKGGQHQKEKNW